MLDPLEPVLVRLLEEWPEIKAPRVTEILREDYGYVGSVDLVKKRLARMRPSTARPAQRTGYRPGQVLQLDWAEMPTRPKIAGRERRVYALIARLPFSGAQTAHFSFDLTAESFLEGHVRALQWLGGVPRECVYDNLRSVVARRDGDIDHLEPTVRRVARPLCLPRDGLHAGDAAREGLSRGRRPLPEDAGSGRRDGSPAWPTWTSNTPTGASACATGAGTRPAGSGSTSASRSSGTRCGRCRRSASTTQDSGRRGSPGRLSQARRLLLPRARAARPPARRAAL